MSLLAAQRLGYRAAHRALQAYWFVFRPQVNGVKVVVRRGDEVLFVRHTYGNRDAWDLPGGSRRPSEDPLAAAQREAREELGTPLTGWRQIGEVFVTYHATAALTCFEARYEGEPLVVREREIEAVRWAPASDPPQPAGKDVGVVLELL